MKQEQSPNRRILIIDDNQNIHKDFCDILESEPANIDGLTEATEAIFGSEPESSISEGFQIDSAFQGEEGLEMIKKACNQECPYALVFIDMRMPPGWDGLKTIEHIWQADPKIQVVICTAYSDYSLWEISERLGKSENLLILKKPFDIIEVAQLAAALTKKWNLARQAEIKEERLELLVNERTSELTNANSQLTAMLEKVENVNQELKDFSSIVSHDLKAPLRGIKTLADWILENCKDKFDEEDNEHMKLLLSRIERMYNLIDGVLRYSRVGRLDEEKSQVDLNKLVLEVIDMVVPPENFEIIVENKLPTIQCQETHMIQLFQNLLSNAIKYMDKPKGVIKINCLEEHGFWKFRVTDNGMGIEEKHFERIFKMFQSLQVKEEFESTGVGLAIVKKIVELNGGKIWIESQIGLGTNFLFTLSQHIQQDAKISDEKLQSSSVS